MNKIILLTFAFLLITLNSAFAGSSANYFISAEVIDLGGASAASTNYKMLSKVREAGPQVTTSAGYTLEGRFMGMIVGSGAIITGETPVITSIRPNKGYNNISYRVVINGANISSDAAASLTSLSQPAINGTDVSIESSTSMECTFDLTGSVVGARNVTVTNTGFGKIGVLASGFTVLSPGRVKIIGTPFNDPNPFNPSSGPTMIKYKLNTSAAITLYLFNQKGELIWQRTYSAGENGGVAGGNAVAWSGISDFREDVPSGVYLLSIISRAGGSTRELGRIKIAVIRQ
jgi:hypothetical protein